MSAQRSTTNVPSQCQQTRHGEQQHDGDADEESGRAAAASNAPPAKELRMPPIRPMPDANPTPDVRHSVGNTCADTMYRPVCNA